MFCDFCVFLGRLEKGAKNFFVEEGIGDIQATSNGTARPETSRDGAWKPNGNGNLAKTAAERGYQTCLVDLEETD